MDRLSLILALIAFGAGCASTGAVTDTGPTCATDAPASMPMEDGWWNAADAACPSGATLATLEERRSTMTFCTTDRGRHGPFRAVDGDVVLAEGWYVHGEQHGRWRRYDGITSQYVVEVYDCGRVLERRAEPPDPAQATGP